MTKAAFLIAAPTSGSGKTTIARGLMALLTMKGLRVQPFKCGPDYIDTKFHEAVCHRPSINLDTFMASPQHVRELFARYGADADVCIVEGMMGLFDGYDRDRGSSAEIAQVLGLPVVLVVDAKAAAYSTAALLSGFIHFREGVRISGVIFNRVGSERHYKMLQQVCQDLSLRCLGYLPKNAELEQGSRYLGLDFSEHAPIGMLTQLLEQHVDWQQLSAPFSFPQALSNLPKLGEAPPSAPEGATIAPALHDKTIEAPSGAVGGASSPQLGGLRGAVVARNAESFSFLYQETLDGFARVSFFDPEKEVPQLEGCDLLYLPGGYPEKHLEALAGNEAARQAIRDYAERGGRVVAECGGMMYLCREIVSDEGSYPMCGVLPYSISARRADRRLSLGYRQFTLDGRSYRGHEFHYTQFLEPIPPSACQVFNALGEPVPTPVFRWKNVLASYTHLYPNYEADIY